MRRVLVVDDSPVERLMLQALLVRQSRDLAVSCVASGEAAIKAAGLAPYDLIIADVQMTGMTGLELIQELRSAGHEIPVVIVTGFGSESLATEAIAAGAASYVPKSGFDQYLVSTVESVLRLSKKRATHRRLLGKLEHQELRFCLDNDTSMVDSLVEMVHDSLAAASRFGDGERMQVSLALTEALTNAINHGNLELDSQLRQEDETIYHSLGEQRRHEHPYADRRVYLRIAIATDGIEVRIRDEGPGFDPTSVMQRLEDAPLDRIGGRGLMLIHSFMDAMSFNATGNEIRFAKSVPAPVGTVSNVLSPV